MESSSVDEQYLLNPKRIKKQASIQNDSSSDDQDNLFASSASLQVKRDRKQGMSRTSSVAISHAQSVVAHTNENVKHYYMKHLQQREYHRIFDQWRFYDFCVTVFSSVGLVLGMVSFELGKNLDTASDHNDRNITVAYDAPFGQQVSAAMDSVRFQASETKVFRYIIFFTSLAAIASLFVRHYYKNQWLKKYFRINAKAQENLYQYYSQTILDGMSIDYQSIMGLKQKRLFNIHFVIEMLSLIIFPYPFFEMYVWFSYRNPAPKPEGDVGDSGWTRELHIYYFLSDFLLAFMFVRLFYVLRSIFNYSIYTDAFSKVLCKSYGFTSGVRFTLKSMLAVQPEKTIFSAFFGSLLVLAYLMRIFEMPYYRQQGNDSSGDDKYAMDSYFNSIHLTVITLTTVGYGDLVPHTTPGKSVAMITALLGAFLISIFVLAVTSVFELSKLQMRALRHITMSRSASRVIMQSVRFFILKKKFYQLMRSKRPDWNPNSKFLALLEEREMNKTLNSGLRNSRLSQTDKNRETALSAKKHKKKDKQQVELFLVSQMDGRELGLYKDMNAQFLKMLQALGEFQQDKTELRMISDQNEEEMLKTSRVVKYEVLEMADMIEQLAEKQTEQDQKLNFLIDMMTNQSGQAPPASGSTHALSGQVQNPPGEGGSGSPQDPGRVSSNAPSLGRPTNEGDHINFALNASQNLGIRKTTAELVSTSMANQQHLQTLQQYTRRTNQPELQRSTTMMSGASLTTSQHQQQQIKMRHSPFFQKKIEKGRYFGKKIPKYQEDEVLDKSDDDGASVKLSQSHQVSQPEIDEKPDVRTTTKSVAHERPPDFTGVSFNPVGEGYLVTEGLPGQGEESPTGKEEQASFHDEDSL